MRGRMIWFNESKDYGFIMTDEGERLSVLGTGFAGGKRPVGRCADLVVSFEIDDSTGTRQAEKVTFDETVAAHRPRLRSGLGARR
jgi:cold shock CspA family protein